jgi:putative salt-induced outer membrane protein YdiY
MKNILAALLVTAFATSAFAQPQPSPAKKWKDSAEASFVNTNGNSKTTTTSAKDAFSYDFDTWTRLELEAGALGSRSNGRTISEQYFAQEKAQRKYDDRDYGFEKYRWDKDRFAGIISRQELSAGLGREFWKNPTNLLIGEAAPGYVNEERSGEKRRSYGSARFHAKYTHDFTATSKFSQDAEYLQSLKDKRDNRLGTETALTTALTTLLSVKTSFIWKHSGQPPPGNVKDDTITSFALIASF